MSDLKCVVFSVQIAKYLIASDKTVRLKKKRSGRKVLNFWIALWFFIARRLYNS